MSKFTPEEAAAFDEIMEQFVAEAPVFERAKREWKESNMPEDDYQGHAQ